jgi:phenylacetate-CoA ligase
MSKRDVRSYIWDEVETLPRKVGMFGAEPWSEHIREEIESRLGIVALNVYGLSEVIGPGVSIECTEKKGMHIFEDHRSQHQPTAAGR